MRSYDRTTLGPRPDRRSRKALNRVIRWTTEGIEYDADPRQAERLISECGLENCQTVAAPGVRATGQDLSDDAQLPPRLTTAFRGSAARGNYLGPDRCDAQFATQDICRFMSKPTVQSWQSLKRISGFSKESNVLCTCTLRRGYATSMFIQTPIGSDARAQGNQHPAEWYYSGDTR